MEHNRFSLAANLHIKCAFEKKETRDIIISRLIRKYTLLERLEKHIFARQSPAY